MFVLTICAKRTHNMEESEWHRYMSENHAPLVREALQRHGITRYSMTHITTESRELMKLIAEESYNPLQVEYDLITQICFPEVQYFVNFRNDPYYKASVEGTRTEFTSAEHMFISVGTMEDHILDSKLI